MKNLIQYAFLALFCSIPLLTIAQEEKTSIEEVFKVVEEMPRFAGCEKRLAKREKEICAQQELLAFIFKEIKYPKAALDKETEGTVVVQFVVEKTGELTEAKVIQAIGDGCDEEALRVVELMPNWIPGRQRDKAVRVQLSLPIKFASGKKPAASAAKKEVNEIFKRVEEMPRFLSNACENLSTLAEKQKCAEKKMLEFVYGNLEYPAKAKKDKVEGSIVVTYIIDKKGEITEAEVVRNLSPECDAEALRVVNMMSAWEPGKQRGKPVNVKYSLPIRFRL